jgi:hypothetical protein
VEEKGRLSRGRQIRETEWKSQMREGTKECHVTGAVQFKKNTQRKKDREGTGRMICRMEENGKHGKGERGGERQEERERDRKRGVPCHF